MSDYKVTCYIGVVDHSKRALDMFLTNHTSGFTVLDGFGHWVDSEGILWTEKSATYVFLVEGASKVTEILELVSDYLSLYSTEQAFGYDVVKTAESGVWMVPKPDLEQGGSKGWIIRELKP